MVEFQDLDVRSPLHGLEALDGGGEGSYALTEVWPFCLTQVAWRGDQVQEIAKALGLASVPQSMVEGLAETRSDDLVLPLMPSRVLYLGKGAPDRDAVTAAGGYTLDLTEGRAWLKLSGGNWRWTLMKGAGLDFETMMPGQVAQTALFKISTLIWVDAADAANMLVSYTFAKALAEKVLDAGLDQGLEYRA